MSKKPSKVKVLSKQVIPCPYCGALMIATKVVGKSNMPKGMYWVCPSCDVHVPVRG